MSTDFGQERLASIANTPLLNPDIDISRAILLSYGDHNSFNWRLSHWNLLLKAWQQFPIFGYGLATAQPIGNGFLAHNDYVRALVEGGIVGLAAFLAFIVAQFVRLVLLIRSAPRGSRQGSLCLTLLAILLSISVGMITENIWSHTTLFFYWWSYLGLLVGSGTSLSFRNLLHPQKLVGNLFHKQAIACLSISKRIAIRRET
jgi:O-antigen ligase